MKKAIIYNAIALLIMIGFSCNNYSSSSTETQSDTSFAESPVTQKSNDSLAHKQEENDMDTVSLSPSPTPEDSSFTIATQPRKAVFGYSFFKNIQEHETRNINAYVSIINAISKVIDTLKEINAADVPERKNDTATVMTKNIFVFKALDIQLRNAGDSDFIIKPFADARQLIDSMDGNSWTWSVTPNTNKLHGRLIMNIIAEKSDGSREPFSTVNIPITIIIDKAIGRTLWQWMMDNPEKVITIILIPFIIFFWKQIVGLFSRKRPPE